MKTALVLIALLCPALLAAHDLRPDASGAPILQVYALLQNSSEGVSLDHAHLLLSVDEVSDIFLKNDKRRVRVVLTADDAKAFAAILQAHEAVGITAGDAIALVKSGRGFHGSLTFDDPVATYLRHRFHVQPNSNVVDAPPANPFAAPDP